MRFTITRTDLSDTQGAPWYVTADVRDSDDDYCWGHFPTHAEAVAFVDAIGGTR